MKNKFIKIGIVFATLLIMTTGCDNTSDKLSGSSNVDNVMDQQIENADNENTNITSTKDKNSETVAEQIKETNTSTQSVDVDLTTMGSDMVYATVYQMMVSPEEYVGKQVKMSGKYSAIFYELTQKYYHYIIISDALECCAQGIEFVWDEGNHVYPDEYPAENAEVEVCGTFETYTEAGEDYLYCRLVNATMNIQE